MKRNDIVLLLVTALFCGSICSCSSPVYLDANRTIIETEYNSFGNYNVAGKTFYIESSNNSISSSDLEFRQYAAYISESLILRNAIPTENKSNADLCILMDYAIADESYIANVPIPIWGQTGISSITTNSSTSGYATGSAYKSGDFIYGSAYGRANTNTTTNVNHSYGITGVYNAQRKVNLFRRALNVYAYDNKKRDSKEMLWKVNLHSDGYKNDLSYIIPFMAYSFMTTVGRSSGGWKTFTTFENDYLFLIWKAGGWTAPTLTPLPRIDANMPDPNISIAFVERLQHETVVVLKKIGDVDNYSFGPEMYLECGDKKVKLSRIDNYQIGKKIRKEIGTRYFSLHFPIVLRASVPINIVEKEGNQIRKYWYGIHLK